MQSQQSTEGGQVLPGHSRLIEFPQFTDARGTLAFLESGHHIPFDIKRVFYLFDVPAGQKRAAHALVKCQQCLVAMSGSVDVALDDGLHRQTYRLDRRDLGLYVPAMVWRELSGFSPDCVCVVLASEYYDPDDYFEDYAEFRKEAGRRA